MILASGQTLAESEVKPVAKSLAEVCVGSLSKFKGSGDLKALQAACAQVEKLDGCDSVNGTPIFHFDRIGSHPSKQKILVFFHLVLLILRKSEEKKAGVPLQ